MTRARSDMTRSARQLMENALTLDVNDLLRRGVLARGSCTRGVISWTGPVGAVTPPKMLGTSLAFRGDARSGRMRSLVQTLRQRGASPRQQAS